MKRATVVGLMIAFGVSVALVIRRRRELAGPGYAPERNAWFGGGCLTFAKALKTRLGRGAKLVDIVEPEPGSSFLRPGRPHHVVVEYRGQLWDAAGAHAPEDLLAFWRAQHGAGVQLEPHDPVRAREQRLRVKPHLQDVANREAATIVAAGGLHGPNASALSDDEHEHVHSPIHGEIDEAVERAVAAGAQAPLAYMGAGAEGVVFCDPTGKAYKVGRHMGRGDLSLETEAAFFRKANQVPAIARNVARFYRYDRDQDVIVRECIRNERTKRGDRRYMPGADTKAWDTAERIHRAMLPYGFTGPERKPDSFVYVRGRGMVLVDGGFAHKVGHELVKDVLAKKAGCAPRGPFEDDEALASRVRWERDRTIPKAIADRVRAKLGDESKLDGARVERVETQPYLDIGDDEPVPAWVVEDEDEIDGVELQSKSNPDHRVLAHRATSGDRPWQATWFDARGPGGDGKQKVKP